LKRYTTPAGLTMKPGAYSLMTGKAFSTSASLRRSRKRTWLYERNMEKVVLPVFANYRFRVQSRAEAIGS